MFSKSVTTLVFIAVFGFAGAGCSAASAGAQADPQAACDQAFAQAMAIDPRSDTVHAVDGAIAGCGSLETWVNAAQRYPDLFGGQDPQTLASERCGASGALADSTVCAQLQGD
jgi:hypothetical protein